LKNESRNGDFSEIENNIKEGGKKRNWNDMKLKKERDLKFGNVFSSF